MSICVNLPDHFRDYCPVCEENKIFHTVCMGINCYYSSCESCKSLFTVQWFIADGPQVETRIIMDEVNVCEEFPKEDPTLTTGPQRNSL